MTSFAPISLDAILPSGEIRLLVKPGMSNVVARILGLLGAVVAGVSVKAMPALLLLLMAGALMTDFAIDECWVCFREAIDPAGEMGGEIREGVVAVGECEIRAAPVFGGDW